MSYRHDWRPGPYAGGNKMLIVPSRRTSWTPAQISTALWLDAADVATVTSVSNAVSNWSDKSGNGRNAVQGISTNQPSYTSFAGLNAITFNGTNNFLDVSTSVFRTTAAYQLYWVAARLGNGTNDGYSPSISFLSNVDRGAYHYIKTSNLLGASYPNFGSSPTWGSYDLSSGTAYSVNQYNIMCFENTSSIWRVYLNSVVEGSNNTGGLPPSDIVGLRIGAQQNPARYSYIKIAEIIGVQSSGATTRQQIEGYLAWKWNLVANLPAGHPYKTTAP